MVYIGSLKMVRSIGLGMKDSKSFCTRTGREGISSSSSEVVSESEWGGDDPEEVLSVSPKADGESSCPTALGGPCGRGIASRGSAC